MPEKKELNNEELNKVSGGLWPKAYGIKCPHCNTDNYEVRGQGYGDNTCLCNECGTYWYVDSDGSISGVRVGCWAWIGG